MKGLGDALLAAGDGYRVFPVGSDKKPLIKSWVQLATTDRDTLERWWKRFPDALVGIATGHGLGVIDLDVKNGQDGPTEWRTWCAERNLPPMEQHMLRTRSVGSRHLPMRIGGPARNAVGLLPGVDIRGDGGYVVAWNRPPKFEDLPEATGPVEALLSAPEKDERPTAEPIGPERDPGLRVHPYAAAVIERELVRLDECELLGLDYWNSTTYAVACNLLEFANSPWSGYSREQAHADLLDRAPTDSGFGRREHEERWDSAIKRIGDKGRPNPDTDPANDFDVVVGDPVAQPVAAELKSSDSSGWQPVNLAGYLDGTYQPPEAKLMQRNDGVALLYPGMTHSIHGESASGKSMLVQAEVVVQLKAGELVLVLDYEADPGSVVERLRLMGATLDDLSRLTYVQPEADHEHSPASLQAFQALLGQAFALVVVDGVNEALAQAPAKARSTGGLGGNDDITAWHDRLPRQIARRTGAAVVLIDHVAKGADAGRFAIGGQAKMATISGAAYLVKPRTPLGRGMAGEIELYVAKDRHGYVRSHAVGSYSADRMQLIATVRVDGTDGLTVDLLAPSRARTTDDRLRQMKERVAALLNELPADHEGAGLNLIKQSVTGNDGLIADALRELVSGGYVDMRLVGQRKLHRLAKPYAPELDS